MEKGSQRSPPPHVQTFFLLPLALLSTSATSPLWRSHRTTVYHAATVPDVALNSLDSAIGYFLVSGWLRPLAPKP